MNEPTYTIKVDGKKRLYIVDNGKKIHLRPNARVYAAIFPTDEMAQIIEDQRATIRSFSPPCDDREKADIRLAESILRRVGAKA